MAWWRENPKAFEAFKFELLDFPSLSLNIENDKAILVGKWPVYGARKLVSEFDIRIEIPNDYPETPPLVFEVSNKIPKIVDRHFSPTDQSACLFARPERWEKWPQGAGIARFLDGPVKEFFFSQAYFDLEGKWPFGEWSHGDKGIIEFFIDRLELESIQELEKILDLLTPAEPPRQWKCVCKKRGRYRVCHWPKVQKLQLILPAAEWDYLRGILAAF
jgi:hypothetical protein